MKKEITYDSEIRGMKPPDKRTEISDSEVNGLYLRITPTGHKSFVYRYRFGDTVKRYTIGSYPAVSLKKARDRARELSVLVSKGTDPLAEKKKARQKPDSMTVRELTDEFKREYLPKKRPTTQKTYKSRINKIVDHFGRYSIDEISQRDIKPVLKKIAKKQQVNANRVQAIFSMIFSYAVKEGYTKNDPLKGMEKIGGKEKAREPNYSHEEIRALWDAFDQQDEPLNSLLKILLLTGQRIGETSRMQWKDIDRNNALWIIPKSQTKGDQTHIVPLSGMAIEVLENVHQLTGKSDYVFVSPMKKGKPLSHFGASTKRIRNLTKIERFRIHDLRHIVITGMISIGIDFVHVGKSVAHKGLGKEYVITNRYAHYEYLDEKKQALDKWSYHLIQILEGKKETKFFKIG